MERPDSVVETTTLEELGFSSVKEEELKLLILNDHVNSMDYVVENLMSICNLNTQEALEVMLTAHQNGRAVAKVGKLSELDVMKTALQNAQIEARIVE